tara:strand:+ start:165 stop:395 length:231 start_codon:yes stop_codon:yes gene_type:complete
MILVIKVIFFISVLICLLRFFGNIVKKLFILIWKYSPLFAIIIAISWIVTYKNEEDFDPVYWQDYSNPDKSETLIL